MLYDSTLAIQGDDMPDWLVVLFALLGAGGGLGAALLQYISTRRRDEQTAGAAVIDDAIELYKSLKEDSKDLRRELDKVREEREVDRLVIASMRAKMDNQMRWVVTLEFPPVAASTP